MLSENNIRKMRSIDILFRAKNLC